MTVQDGARVPVLEALECGDEGDMAARGIKPADGRLPAAQDSKAGRPARGDSREQGHTEHEKCMLMAEGRGERHAERIARHADDGRRGGRQQPAPGRRLYRFDLKTGKEEKGHGREPAALSQQQAHWGTRREKDQGMGDEQPKRKKSETRRAVIANGRYHEAPLGAALRTRSGGGSTSFKSSFKECAIAGRQVVVRETMKRRAAALAAAERWASKAR